jgi:hypothetical protein
MSQSALLRNKFAESIVGQNEQMDKLGQHLITLELAIPGLYATALKLLQGDDAPLPGNSWLYGAFGCWFLALLLTLQSLIPHGWQVDPTSLKRDAVQPDAVLGLEDFFIWSIGVCVADGVVLAPRRPVASHKIQRKIKRKIRVVIFDVLFFCRNSGDLLCLAHEQTTCQPTRSSLWQC